MKKYENADEYYKKRDNQNIDNNKNFLENFKIDRQINNTNLHKIIEKNHSLIENLKNKYLNNIKQNNESTSNELKFPIHKTYRENISSILSSSYNSIESDNLKSFKNINSGSSLKNRKIFENDLELYNKDASENINILRMKYLNENKPISNADINILTKTSENLNIYQNTIFKGEPYFNLSRDPEVNSIINKYKTKIRSSNNTEISSENKKDLILLNDYKSIQKEDLNQKENINNKITFQEKLENANKKIDNINFTFHKSGNEFFDIGKRENEESKKLNLNNTAEESIINKILNKNIEKEKKEIFENEKSKFDFIFKNKENIHSLLFKFKIKEKFSLDDKDDNAKEDINLFENDVDNITNGKKSFINKINFIEEKLNRIENLIKFEENEISKNVENKKDLCLINKSDTENFKRKNSIENDISEYSENFTLGNKNFKNDDIRICKKSVFSELNKNEDITTDDEKLSNNILSFAQNIRNLKDLKEKNNSMLDEIENKNKVKKKDLNIPFSKKSKGNKR